MVPPRSDKVSRAPPYSRICDLSTRTGLSPALADLPKSFRFLNAHHWPGPRSLAATKGVSVDVLSSGYLDVSIPRVCFLKAYVFSLRIPDRKNRKPLADLSLNQPAATDSWQVGCPIRKSTDQRVLAPPRSLSQRATSFIASRRQGIHQMPF